MGVGSSLPALVAGVALLIWQVGVRADRANNSNHMYFQLFSPSTDESVRSVSFTSAAAEIRSASVSVEYNARTVEETYREAAQACPARRSLDVLSRHDSCLLEYLAWKWRLLG